MLNKTRFLLSDAKALFKKINYKPGEELDFDKFVECFLSNLYRVEEFDDAYDLCNIARVITAKWDKFSKLYYKYLDYYNEDTFYKETFKFKLLKKEDSVACYMTDIFDDESRTCFFSDTFYEDFYSITRSADTFIFKDEDELKYQLVYSGSRFKILDKDSTTILEVKQKDSDKVEFITNTTGLSFIKSSENFYDVYSTKYVNSLNNLNDLDYDNNCLGLIRFDFLSSYLNKREMLKYVIAGTLIFEDNIDTDLLNLIAYGFALIYKNYLKEMNRRYRAMRLCMYSRLNN